MDNSKIIAIVGPTGSGKSALAIQLAHLLDGEVISCDSMQVYKKMDIGTAKVTKEEMEGIVHHLIDIQEIDEPYSAAAFQSKCRQAIAEIQSRNKAVILCGGTGLYLKSALYDYEFEQEEQDPQYLSYLESLSNEQLVSLLKEQDAAALKKIHPNNRRRLIRALQIAHSGKSKSSRESEQNHAPLYDVYFLGLDGDREQLRQRTDERVDKMFENGLVQEVQSLFSNPQTWSWNSFQGIGYKEFRPWFEGKCSLDEVRQQIKIHSRQYSKRQMTWFRHQMPVHFFDYHQTGKAIEEVLQWYYGNSKTENIPADL